MLKKLKDVLEKDKTRFSNEELEWQQKFERETILFLLVTFFISVAIVVFISILVPKNKTQELIILVIWFIVLWVIGSICFCFSNGGFNARKQLEEKREQQKREKVLFYLEKKDYSRLKLKNDEIAQVLFQLAMKEDIIKFKSIQELKMTFIDIEDYGSWGAYNEDNVLEIFDIKE